MALSPGTRLGPYEILSALGAGGMGEVYRARDSKLNRDVAIKVLPDSVANDPERLARFTREAQVLAALNHPNIAHIYFADAAPLQRPVLETREGSGPSASSVGVGPHASFLVMELVEGEDLSQRIARGAISLDEALPVARQIIEALEAAHEHGIIHRDLKPANIKVRADGMVKVLDFGLAKAMEPAAGSSPSLSMSPTITTPAMTQAGMILGTAAYMSPEQAKGRVVDKRSDVWAFGCVFFEMLTGRRAFDGEDVTDTIAAVVRGEPGWSALPADVPEQIRLLLKRCLEKDRNARISDVGVARFLLTETMPPPAAAAVTAPRARSRWRTVAAAIVAVLIGASVAATATWALLRTPPAPLQPVRFALVPPAAQALAINGNDRDLALSPDGTHLVYVAAGDTHLMVRAIDQLDAVPVRGITGARSPFLSPDGRWIGFFANGLQKVSIAGGPPLLLCPISGFPRGASWGPDETIIFATNDTGTGLLRVSAAGGAPTVLTTPDAAHGELAHLFPSVLPGGHAVLFTITAAGPIETAQVAVLDLTTGHYTTLIHGGSQAEYVAPAAGSGPAGYLVYAVAGTLRAVRFDPVRLEVLSDPVPVVEQVTTLATGAAEFAVSRQGALVYYVPGGAGSATRSLVWVTPQGHEDPITAAPPRAYTLLRLSSDGTRVALDIRDQENDIWIWDLARQTLTRLTDSPRADQAPVWTPDGTRVIFASARAGALNLYWQAADNTGTVERLTTSPNVQLPRAIAPDGTRLIVREDVPKTGSDLRVLRMAGTGPRQTEPLLQTTFAEDNGEISPDGHWLAYQSNESGQYQISVRPFPTVDSGHWTISTNGGTTPLWARSGKELFYRDGANAMMSVPIQTAPAFRAGNPTKLFDWRNFGGPGGRVYDVSRDGQRFLMIKNTATGDQTSTSPSMVVVLNWVEELKARLR